MKVLQVHNRQQSTGGADALIDQEAAGLRARGHEVDGFFITTDDVYSRGSLHAGAAALWNRDATRALRTLLDRWRPDIVHVHTPFPVMSPAVLRVAGSRGAGVVMTTHSWRLNCVNGTLFRDGHPCERCVGRRVKVPAIAHRCYHGQALPSLALAGSLAAHQAIGSFARVDKYLALTPFMRERLIAEGIPPDKVIIKPNAVRDPGPVRDVRSGHLLFGGRLEGIKGIDTLLDAWARTTVDQRLIIAGDGPMRDQVDQAARSDERMDVRGWVDSRDMSELVRDAAAVVLPSVWYEGLPMALVEAYAAGTPVIVSDIANLGDLVEPDVTGVRFRTGDAAALAAAIETFVDDADQPALRAGARRTYEAHYHPERVLDLLETVYDEVRTPHPKGR